MASSSPQHVHPALLCCAALTLSTMLPYSARRVSIGQDWMTESSTLGSGVLKSVVGQRNEAKHAATWSNCRMVWQHNFKLMCH